MKIPIGFGLTGKVAIVTGAGASAEGIGNGRAAALLLAAAGARVAVVDRDTDRADTTAKMITEEGGEALVIAGDISQQAFCEHIVSMTMETFGRLDVLDNNVGIGSRGSVVTETQERWQRVMQLNVETMFLMAKYAVPAMVESGGGSIINISSISAVLPRGLTAYSTSKGAVIALTKAMAVDHGAEGVRVNCICPGPVFTPMVYAAGMTEEARENRRNSGLLKTEGTGWDIGNAVLFLASDMARYITGQTLVVDGGVTLNGPNRDS